MSGMTERLEAMLAAGQDNLLLRFSLGKARLEDERLEEACDHLRRALEFDDQHSNAWKLLGKALLQSGDREAARTAWTRGVSVAQARGDAQVERELTIFLKRLSKEDAARAQAE